MWVLGTQLQSSESDDWVISSHLAQRLFNKRLPNFPQVTIPLLLVWCLVCTWYFLLVLVWFLTVKRFISFLLQWLAMSLFAHLLLCLVVLYMEGLQSSPHVKGGVLKYSCLGRRLVVLDRYTVSACFLTLEMVHVPRECGTNHEGRASALRTLWERALWKHYISRVRWEWSPASPAEGTSFTLWPSWP